LPTDEHDNYQTALYRIGGLKGDHCRDRIEHVVSHLGGVEGVDVDLAAKQVLVHYDPASIASGYIKETLQSLGYSIRD